MGLPFIPVKHFLLMFYLNIQAYEILKFLSFDSGVYDSPL